MLDMLQIDILKQLWLVDFITQWNMCFSSMAGKINIKKIAVIILRIFLSGINLYLTWYNSLQKYVCTYVVVINVTNSY